VSRWTSALVLSCLATVACQRDPAAIPAVGTLERDRIELTAEENEPIVSVEVKEGDVVEAGHVLMVLDQRRLEAQLGRARGSRNQLAARLAELERGPRMERIREARAKLEGTESAAKNAQLKFDRSRQLESQSFESAAVRDQMRAQRDAAIAARDQARATLDEMERGTTSEELDQARGALAAADATVADTEVRLERLTVRAPRPGRVDSLPFERGERPPAGAVVAVMLAADPPYARVYVPAAARARISEGTRAQVTITGREGALEAHVKKLAHEAAFTPYYALTQHDRGRLSYLAEVEIEGAGTEDLPTGVPVEVRFELETRAVNAK
jgi:HlyD family secretion protein